MQKLKRQLDQACWFKIGTTSSKFDRFSMSFQWHTQRQIYSKAVI